MKINLTSVPVHNQEEALTFYTEVLGFSKKTDQPLGEHRWLTVVSPEVPDGPELLLEPLGFPPAKIYQQALFEAGIPYASFAVDDVHAEHDRLSGMGVAFSMPPTRMGAVTLAVFADGCGNNIQIAHVE